jgi:hypothetical protein
MGKPLDIPEIYNEGSLREFQTPKRHGVPNWPFIHLGQASGTIILTIFPWTLRLVAFRFKIVEPKNRFGRERRTLNGLLYCCRKRLELRTVKYVVASDLHGNVAVSTSHEG